MVQVHEDDLLDRYAKKELSFIVRGSGGYPLGKKLAQKLTHDLAAYPPELVALARYRVQYLKEIDRR